MVPRTPRVVNVLGRVYNPANSTTEGADRDRIFVVQADGSVLTLATVERGFQVLGDSGLMSAKLEAGDAIVIPEKLVFSLGMKDVKDITQIMMQLTVTLGVFLAIP